MGFGEWDMILISGPELTVSLITVGLWILVGATAGWLFSLRSTGFGLLGNVVVGILGAILGSLLIRFLLPLIGVFFLGSGGWFVSVIVGGIIGAWTLLAISRAALRRRGVH